MASNTSLNLSSLDFNTLKDNFKSFLTSQSVFKDYMFEDSNMGVLLDVLSYNTYLNSFYLNMVASEMFLDSAQKYNSVISHAKELNYIPRSTKSSTTSLSFNISTIGVPNTLTIPQGTIFSGTNSNGTFTFVTDQTQTYTSPNNYFTVSNLAIYEGTYVTDTYVVDYTNENLIYTLSNQNIDIDSLNIVVTESGTNTIFSKVSTLFDLNSQSNVYFLQASQNNQYEFLFGDSLFGRIPNNLSIITASYRVASGPSSDGVSTFTCLQDIGTLNGGQATLSAIAASSSSASGANQETLDSIKFSAPRYFATQQRAVASDDYSALIFNNFGGYISDVNIYGGELLEPKQFGRVAVCLKPVNGLYAPDYIKNEINDFLTKYISLPTRIITTDPQYLYVGINSIVEYAQTQTNILPNQLQSLIINTILTFSNDNLEKFNKDFRYSQFVAQIDNTTANIISNITEVTLIKRITPLINIASNFVINYGNSANIEDFNPSIGYNAYTKFADEPILTSSLFSYFDGSTTWPICYMRDDNVGNIVIFTNINNKFVVLSTVGTIDYVYGQVNIKNLVASNFGDYISLYLKTKNKDILVDKDNILLIDANDITINVISN